MTDYTTNEIETALNSMGEVLLILDSDAYAEPIELHKHDTTIDHESGEIILELADGQIQFKAASIESITAHEQSTADLGL